MRLLCLGGLLKGHDASPAGGRSSDKDKILRIDGHPLLFPRRASQRFPDADEAALELFCV